MKKLVTTTRPFRYDPNQIPYLYTVEVAKSECLKKYEQMFVRLYRSDQDDPHEKEMQKTKTVV